MLERSWGEVVRQLMGIEYKDYYKILGVAREASTDEIKKAFRKLAAKYHPDRHAGDKRMEEKFKEVSEAYEVLRDPDKRRAYDGLGTSFRPGQQINPDDLGNIFGQFFGGGRRPAGQPGARPGAEQVFTGPGGATFTFHGPGSGGSFSDFFETLFGGGGGRGGNPFAGMNMGGEEADPFARLRGGAGATGGPQPGFGMGQTAGAHVETELTISVEDALRGTTRRIAFQRGAPGGPASTQTYDVKIPAGIRDGQKIRLRGQGSSIGGQTGDILITVRLAPDPRYKLEGDHLVMELPLTPWEAALGGRISVTTPAGPAEVNIPAGMASGKRLRLKGRGWPLKGGARGDLYMRISIKIPKELNDQERDLFERLARVSTFNPRT